MGTRRCRSTCTYGELRIYIYIYIYIYVHIHYFSLVVPPCTLYILCMQDCPDAIDIPALVTPKSDKLDLEHFFRDLQKCKPWLSATAWEAWECFTATSDDLFSSQLADVQWRLPELVSAAIIAAQASMQDSPVPPKVCVYCAMHGIVYNCIPHNTNWLSVLS